MLLHQEMCFANDFIHSSFILQNGPQAATYDVQLKVPVCNNIGTSCDTGITLVRGRSGIGPELNQPNTLDACQDGAAGTLHSDESVDRIAVKTMDGTPLSTGSLVSIEATVWAYNPAADRADFYYTDDASSTTPEWVLIGTVAPSGTGTQVLTSQYVLPHGSFQAVRVNFRYKGQVATETACSTGVYDDVDDVAFYVRQIEVSGLVDDLISLDDLSAQYLTHELILTAPYHNSHIMLSTATNSKLRHVSQLGYHTVIRPLCSLAEAIE